MRDTTRDKTAHRLGIATVTLSKYRIIIKIPDGVIESIGRMLDYKKTTLEVTYRISGLGDGSIIQLVGYIVSIQTGRLTWSIDGIMY